MGSSLAPPQGHSIWCISLNSSTGAGASTQVHDGNFRNRSTWIPDWLEPEGWWLRFLDHPVTSPATSQKKVIYPGALPPDLPLKTLPSKPLGNLGFLSIEMFILLAWPLQLTFLCSRLWRFGLLIFPVGHTNLGSTTFSVTTVSNLSSAPFFLLLLVIPCTLDWHLNPCVSTQTQPEFKLEIEFTVF